MPPLQGSLQSIFPHLLVNEDFDADMSISRDE